MTSYLEGEGRGLSSISERDGLIVAHGWNLIMVQTLNEQNGIVFRGRTSSVPECRCSLRRIRPITHHPGLPFGYVRHEAECGSEGQIFRFRVLGEVEGENLCRLALL